MGARAADPPLLAAQLVLVLAWLGLPFLSLAPNRLVSGQGVFLAAVAPGWLAGGLVAVAALRAARTRLPATMGLSVMMPVAAGLLASRLADGLPAAARVSLGGGFWIAWAVAVLTLGRAVRLAGWGPRGGMAVTGVVLSALVAAGWAGAFGALSIAREAAAQGPAVSAALARHVTLVAVSLAGALAVGVPAGLAAWRWRGARAPLFGVLTAVQTVPAVALFGLLMVPLGRAGFSGIGAPPAVIALVLYALLPVTRAVVTGLEGVPHAVVEAARAMGMSPARVMLSARLPLAAPVLLAGLRVTLVQLIGLAVVAALIGAGGLGDFVFQGLGQYATDLVLLGALPACALALAADAVLRMMTRAAA